MILGGNIKSDVAVAWGRPVAVALIRPLACEPPYAVGAAQENGKKTKKKKKKERKKEKKKSSVRLIVSSILETMEACISVKKEKYGNKKFYIQPR